MDLSSQPTRLVETLGSGTAADAAARLTNAIDLLQKILIIETADGVRILHNHPPYLADRHGIDPIHHSPPSSPVRSRTSRTRPPAADQTVHGSRY